MHKFRSSKSLFRLKLGSLMFVLLVGSLLLLVPAVIWVTLLGHREHLYHSGIVLGVAIVSGIIYLAVGTGVRCPLCHCRVIGKQGCSRNHKASKLFGSYRLRVATGILFLGRYHCQYCGEPCKCQTRG